MGSPPPQNPPLIISVTGPPGGTAHGCSKPLDTFKLVEVANLQNGGGGGAPFFFSPPAKRTIRGVGFVSQIKAQMNIF